MLTALLTALLVCLAYVLFTALFFHFVEVRRVVDAITASALVFSPLIGVVCPFVAGRHWGLGLSLRLQFVLYTGLLFTFIWYAYVQVYVVVWESITTGFLVGFLRSGGSMTVEQMESVYSFREVQNDRIRSMVRVGVLEESRSEDGVILIPAFSCRVCGAVLHRVKEFLGWGRGG